MAASPAVISTTKTTVNNIQGYQRERWMQNARGESLLSELNMPGTHDSGALVGGPAVQTQTQSIASQLLSGIRLLDIRGRHVSNQLEIYHGIVPQFLSFADVQKACVSFLETHPSECIVMMVKDESNPENNTRTYQDTFNSYVSQTPPGTWYLGEQLPTLDQVRGKIVLLRRFDASTPEGIDCTYWQDDTTFTISDPDGVTLRVQDCYNVPTLFQIEDKGNKVRELLDEAAAGSHDANRKTWYLNFTSGVSAGAYPDNVAKGSPGFEGVNEHLNKYLSTHNRARYGSIPMDFPETPGVLVPRIINMNELEHCWSLPLDLTALNHAVSKLPPALTASDGEFHLAFLDSNNSKTNLWMCSRTKTGGWTPCLNITELNHAASRDMPALATLNQHIYMAFLDDNKGKNDLWSCQSPDGKKWSVCSNITSQNGATSRLAPTIAAFDGKLYMAFLNADMSKNEISICSSSDGLTWSAVTSITSQNRAATYYTPSLAAFHGKLYLAFRDSNPKKTDIWICSSPDGTNWKSPCVNLKNQNGVATQYKPTLAAAGNHLCMAFVDDKPKTPDIWVCSTPDGENWSACANITSQNPGSAAHWATALAFDGNLLGMTYLSGALEVLPTPAPSHVILFNSILPLP